MRREVYANGLVVRIEQVDATQFTATNPAGTIIEQRPSTAAEQAAVTADTANTNADTLRAAASGALDTNRTYLAIATPTNAQVSAQVRALTQQNVRIIRLLLGMFDGTS